MSTTLSQIDLFTAALALPQPVRAELAERLLASLEKPPGVWSIDDPGLGAELDRRIDELDSGKVQAIGLSDVRRKIDELLSRRRGN